MTLFFASLGFVGLLALSCALLELAAWVASLRRGR